MSDITLTTDLYGMIFKRACVLKTNIQFINTIFRMVTKMLPILKYEQNEKNLQVNEHGIGILIL